MALIGYEAERQKIEAAMAAIRKQVDGHAAASAAVGGPRPKRIPSGAAKPRMGAAPKAAPKLKLSAAAKANLVRNLAKARAAKAAKTRRLAAAA
jgi:hypothetical protein